MHSSTFRNIYLRNLFVDGNAGSDGSAQGTLSFLNSLTKTKVGPGAVGRSISLLAGGAFGTGTSMATGNVVARLLNRAGIGTMSSRGVGGQLSTANMAGTVDADENDARAVIYSGATAQDVSVVDVESTANAEVGDPNAAGKV